MSRNEYNLVVIGAGPAGQAAARKAAFFGHNVALVDRLEVKLTPRKRLRRIMHKLCALQNEGVFPNLPLQIPEESDESEEANSVRSFIRHALSAFRDDSFNEKEELHGLVERTKMHNIDVMKGNAKFLNLDEIEVKTKSGKRIIEGRNVIISTGSGIYHPEGVEFDNKFIHDAKTIFSIEEIPESIMIFGAYLNACQFAVIFSLLGSKVTLFVEEKVLFPEVDMEIHQHFLESFSKYGIEIAGGTSLATAHVSDSEEHPEVFASTDRDHVVAADMLLFTAVNAGHTDSLKCDEAGVETDECGNVIVDKNFCSTIPHIYAVGDVVKMPTVESARSNQGRVAVNHMFGLKDAEQSSDSFPLGIFMIPEMAMFGETEEEVKTSRRPYVVGRANHQNIPFGNVAGVNFGLMKIIVARDTEQILGVHIIGRGAHEVIHYGMHLVEDNATLGKVIGCVFNGATLHELYTYAALDALYKLRK